jgi:hypothetical protein
VAERGADQIRQEMAAERTRLEDSRAALGAELRSFVPVVVVGLVVLGLVTAERGLRLGIRAIRRLS